MAAKSNGSPIRVSLTERDELWHDVTIQEEGAEKTGRVRYWIFDHDETLDRRLAEAERLKAAVGGTEADRVEVLIEQLDQETRDKQRAELLERIVDWDFQDADGNKLPVDEDVVRGVLRKSRYLVPLYQGLLEASGPGRKKT